MAATWRALQTAIAYASAKDMINVFNATGSAKILKVTRAFFFNNGTGAVTGVLNTLVVRRITTATSGSAVTPVKHDTNSSALDANTTAGTGQTVTGTDQFRHVIWSNDEPAVSAATMDEWELLVPNAQIWEAGYGDTNVEPIVCRAVQGFDIQSSGASAVGTADAEIEFTNN